jgi:DNA-directed RNA polymerase specialized sigma24 family protein
MARDPQIDSRLQRWGEWVVVGDASGYSRVCTLHESWSPPTPGMRPTLKVSASTDVRHTHRAVQLLPVKLRNVCVVHYVLKGTLQEQADRLDCMPDTVLDRVERAHRRLAREFCEFQSSV